MPINQNRIKVSYNQTVTVIIKSNSADTSLKAAIIHHGFVTHSTNMNQRYVYLNIENSNPDQSASDQYVLTIRLPPNPTIIAPGPHYIYVFNNDAPCVSGVEVLLNSQ